MEAMLPGAVAWLEAAAEEIRTASLVPGLRDVELLRVAALGGIARCLGATSISDPPGPVRVWAEAGPTPPDTLIHALVTATSPRTEILARLYELAVSGPSRRVLGTFFTPPAVVDYMVSLVANDVPAPKSIVDPGAGVGAFTLAVAKRWPDATVSAVDINFVTLGLLAAAIYGSTNQVQLTHADFLDWVPDAAPSLAGPRIWIGNPPYTRSQSMTAGVRGSTQRLDSPLVTSGHTGLSTYFLAAILGVMKPADATCLLLPGSWMDARYGQPVRAALEALEFREVGLVAFDGAKDLFPDTQVNGMVLYVGPESPRRQSMWTAHAKVLDGSVVTASKEEHDRALASGASLGHRLWPTGRTGGTGTDGIALESVATVRRGVATGANRLFLLTQKEAAAYPPMFVKRAIHRLREISGQTLDFAEHERIAKEGGRGWLLEIPAETLLQDYPALAAWTSLARDAVGATYLGSHREAWFAVEHVDPPDIVVGAMGKGSFRAVRNLVGAVHLNALYGVYLKNADHEVADALTIWLNSPEGQQELARRSRAYGRQLLKLEPRNLREVQIPAKLVQHWLWFSQSHRSQDPRSAGRRGGRGNVLVAASTSSVASRASSSDEG